MQFTNFTINRQSPLTRGQIQKTFSKEGININEEVRKEQFNIKDENDRIVKQEEIQKAKK